MIVLLPPSEGKARPAAGAPLDLGALSFPELTPQRERLLDALTRVCGGNPKRALAALGLSAGQAAELELNERLRAAPAAPASEVYTGVLYERLRLPEAPNHDCVLIASALWGMLRPGDRIPAYRMAMGAKLPRLKGLAAFWREPLRRALPDDGLFVDMRSGAYAAAWTPPGTVVAVRAFSEAPDGTRKVVSHMAKAARGDVARALLLAREPPGDAEAVAHVAEAAGLRVELHGGSALDVIVQTAAA